MAYLQKYQKNVNKKYYTRRVWLFAIVLVILLILFLWHNVTSLRLAYSIIFSVGNLRHDDYYFDPYAPLGRSPPPQPTLNTSLVHQQKAGTYDAKDVQETRRERTQFNPNGVSNMTWDYMMGILGVKSFLDIGCGRGYSTNYFHSKGARVLCIEGSHDAVMHTLLPSQDLIVEHDFTRGAYWPEETFDACWSVEFLEHVSRQYFKNYINAFRKCALIFITTSSWVGYHRVSNAYFCLPVPIYLIS
jgi:SAM-dependent methyltransferase